MAVAAQGFHQTHCFTGSWDVHSGMKTTKLSGPVIADNYDQGIRLAMRLIEARENLADGSGMDITDWAQSVFGTERLVRLIETEPFSEKIYAPVIREEIERLAKTWYPDVGKRHIVSINKLEDEFDVHVADDEAPSSPLATVSADQVLDFLSSRLTSAQLEYLRRILKNSFGEDRDFSWNERIFRLLAESESYLQSNIDRMMAMYPDGPPLQEHLHAGQTFSDEQIITCYKNVFLGINARFPIHFLTTDGNRRAAILTQFAVEHILKTRPLDALQEYTARDFSAIGLRNVARFFNYSLNRIIRNAYPDLVMPWEMAHVEDGFWTEEKNRTMAIRWLIEEKLGIAKTDIPKALRDDRVTKSSFTQNGLSYMFVQYYKSVSRCIGAAYPEFMPWELGSVPNAFWQGEEGRQNVVKAIHWLMRRMQIIPAEIPERIKDKTINRELFSRFGLATVFERIFKKNMFQVFETAYPGRFEIWEIGKVATDYWEDLLHAYRASLWIAKKEGIPENGIHAALRSGMLSRESFAKYGLGSMLKRTFDNNLRKAYLPYILPDADTREQLMKDITLLQLIKRQLRLFDEQPILIRIVRYMFYRFAQNSVERTYRRIYERLRKRTQRRLDEILAMMG